MDRRKVGKGIKGVKEEARRQEVRIGENMTEKDRQGGKYKRQERRKVEKGKANQGVRECKGVIHEVDEEGSYEEGK